MLKPLMLVLAGLALPGLATAQYLVEGEHYEVLDRARWRPRSWTRARSR